jgi:hypothetical protein
MKTIYLLISVFVICIQITLAQTPKNVIFYNDYVTFKGKEYNRLDAKGNKIGTWLKLKKDTLHKKVVITIDDDKNLTEVDLNKFNWDVIGKGECVNNMRQGKWIYGYNDLSVKFVDVIYVNNELSSPIIFYNEGIQWLKADWQNDKWFFTLWDDDIKKFVDTHQKNTVEKLFLSVGIDYTFVK